MSLDIPTLVVSSLAALLLILLMTESRAKDYRDFIKYLQSSLDECHEFSRFCLMLGEKVEQAPSVTVASDLYRIRGEMIKTLSVSEMRVAAFDLYEIKSGEIAGSTLDEYSISLLSYAVRTGTIEQLKSWLKLNRPAANWG